ncbi:DUF4160 domain-containing protein [Marinicauda salina]|uniref:DUF4160 domain-containing protein n=1 Tax=Marinicauda salina TaxID=2135793 RepID=A0A2U2BY29_9PROT|nr:DUF4160 domain-containing protein [Marinicauda salina]PWE18897.1 DUF4160 domain-containing protein [Marinicauda salina]
MPTVLRIDGFRFYFYSHEPNEPPHVHVDKAGASAKLWLDPVALARNTGFKAPDLRTVLGYVVENRETLLEAWHDFFGD